MTDDISRQEASRVVRICVIALSLEWIIFGSCHFVFYGLTSAELPNWFPFKQTVVVLTGMVEVATGILILFPKTRRWAALASIALLVVFLLPIFHMLTHDSALPNIGTFGDNLVRVLLVPNHILLALCAIHLYSSREPSNDGPAQLLVGVFAPRRSVERPTGAFVVAFVMLSANAAGFLVVFASPWNQPNARLWAMMCLALGAAAGFLFGVPRVNSRLANRSGLRPNSNIEVISDWLTKIIVGVGLVEFRKIGNSIDTISGQLGQSFIVNPTAQPGTSAAAFAKALIIYFTLAGAIQGYLLTRLYLTREFQVITPNSSPMDQEESKGKNIRRSTRKRTSEKSTLSNRKRFN